MSESDSEDDDPEVRKYNRRAKRRAKISRYVGDFWAPFYSFEMRIENFKLAHFMRENFGIYSSDESTYHHFAEDRCSKQLAMSSKMMKESQKNLEESNQTLKGANENVTVLRKAQAIRESDLISKEFAMKEKEEELNKKERRLDARGVLNEEDATKIDSALMRLEDEGDMYIFMMEKYNG